MSEPCDTIKATEEGENIKMVVTSAIEINDSEDILEVDVPQNKDHLALPGLAGRQVCGGDRQPLLTEALLPGERLNTAPGTHTSHEPRASSTLLKSLQAEGA